MTAHFPLSAKIDVSLTGDRRFESISLQRRVRCEPCLSREFAFLPREKPQFSAGMRAGASRTVGRDAQDAATSGLRAVISLSGYIPVPHRRWVIFEFGSGSGNTERGPLIEWRAQPRRAETDVDLVDAHLDPFDQGSEDSMLACHGQLGPVLADVCGARDKSLLH